MKKRSCPKVFLFYKESAYKHHFKTRKKFEISEVDEKIAARFKNTHEQHYRALSEVEGILRKYKITYAKSVRGKKVDFSGYDLVISVGGDGTVLEAARGVVSQKILGVNSDPKWSIGRFCAATAKTFPEFLEGFLHGKSKEKRLQRIRLRIESDLSTVDVNILNDLLICHRNPAAMSRYYLKINQHKEEQRSSGVWIATAVGSTGAIHSAGGPVLPLTSKKMQYHPRELHYSQQLHNKLKGGVVMAPKSFEVTSLMREGMIYVDGSHLRFSFHFGAKAIISQSSQPLRIIGL
ncbi:MAG: NAD(+)/NADH kinase [Candidatus Omnitrophica bacterium]|nr:NAD(+)/NADH kinase [Candidatus Omnitrophota bacterium]